MDSTILFSWKRDTEIVDKRKINQYKSLLRKNEKYRFFQSLVRTNSATSDFEVISLGDHVLIASDDSDLCYIARVDCFHEPGSQPTAKFATVTWFFRQNEIPKKKLPSPCLRNEIFLCSANADNIIDAETILETCQVYFDVSTHKNSDGKTFYCRKSFDGRKFKLLDPPSSNLHEIAKRQAPSRSKVTANPKTPVKIISEKSIWSTLSLPSAFSPPAPKSNNTSLVASTKLTSPLAASRVGLVDVSSAALDILESNSDESDDSDIDALPVKRDGDLKMSQRTSNRVIDTKTKGKISKISPLQTNKNSLNLPKTKLLPLLGGLDDKSPKTEKDDEEVNKEKSGVRRSTRSSRKRTNEAQLKSVKPRKCKTASKSLSHLERNSEASSEEDSDLSLSDAEYKAPEKSSSDEAFNSEDDFMEEPKITFRRKSRSARAKKSSSSTTSKLSRGRLSTPVGKKTPKNRRAVIPLRKTPVRLAMNDLDKACENLHVSSIPDSLPCRENEFQVLYSFIEGKILSGTGGCIYISGVPGTGKTATVMEVLSCLRQACNEGFIDDFNYVEINGMRLTEPHQAYVSIWKQLKGLKATPDHAAELLSKHFSMRGKKTTVLLVDELDLLWTRKQDVLYHIFDWPSHRHARLVVVAIANTMDLPERIMMNRVASRLGLTRLSFLPYNYKQLQEIISSRLNGIRAFESDAVQLVARKIAAVSGDARRCLDVCRRAIEIAKREKRANKLLEAASIDHIHEALQEMFASPMIMLIRNCSVHEKLYLRSIVAEFRRSGLEEATILSILNHHRELAKLDGLPPITVTSLIKVCYQLAASRVLIVESGGRDIHANVRLNVSVDDVMFALNADSS